MIFWLLTVCLFVLASLFILVPLWRQRDDSDPEQSEQLRTTANIALFEERQSELRTEFAAGNLDQEQFDNLLLELQQNLLADVPEREQAAAGESGKPGESGGSRGSREKKAGAKAVSAKTGSDRQAWGVSLVIPAALALLIPVSAYLLYNEWGYIEDVELMDLFQRTVDNVDDAEEAQRLIISLGEVVQADEDRSWAWYFLAENFAGIGMFTEAEIAYERAALRLDESPEQALVLGRVAMTKYINADFKITGDVREVIERARAINPNEITSLNLLATDAAEREDYASAIEYWRLLIQTNPDSPQAQTLRTNIAAAGQRLREQNPESAAGPGIDVKLRLAEGLELADELRVFVAARNAEREGLPPLAAIDLTVAGLPATVRLDNSSAVGPFNLSSADTVFVSALVSHAGIATPRSGDYRVVSETFTHNGENTEVELIITDQIP